MKIYVLPLIQLMYVVLLAMILKLNFDLLKSLHEIFNDNTNFIVPNLEKLLHQDSRQLF